MLLLQVLFPLTFINRRWDGFCTIDQRFNNSPLVGNFTIDLRGQLTVVLSTDSDIQKRYFPICFSFNCNLDRCLDIVQMMLQGLYKAGINGRTHIIHISFPIARLYNGNGQCSFSQGLPLQGLPLQLIT